MWNLTPTRYLTCQFPVLSCLIRCGAALSHSVETGPDTALRSTATYSCIRSNILILPPTSSRSTTIFVLVFFTITMTARLVVTWVARIPIFSCLARSTGRTCIDGSTNRYTRAKSVSASSRLRHPKPHCVFYRLRPRRGNRSLRTLFSVFLPIRKAAPAILCLSNILAKIVHFNGRCIHHRGEHSEVVPQPRFRAPRSAFYDCFVPGHSFHSLVLVATVCPCGLPYCDVYGCTSKDE